MYVRIKPMMPNTPTKNTTNRMENQVAAVEAVAAASWPPCAASPPKCASPGAPASTPPA
jgi:hypothetical protein